MTDTPDRTTTANASSSSAAARRRPGTPGPRIAVLWAELSGYVYAQLSALVDQGAELVVVYEISSSQAPFDAEAVTRGLDTHGWSGAPDESKVEAILEEFQPDAILVISWHIGAYRRISRRWRGRALRVLCQTNQWWGTAKQWGGVAISKFVIRPTYDVALLTGERQAEFARRLGFTYEQLIWGMNTGDYPTFSRVAAERKGALPPEAFLYVGRLVPDKAIDVLAEGYRRYRRRVANPWPLLVAGTGPEAHHLHGLEGVEMLGFVQPADLPDVFARAGCLVLPSRFEPWGVVIHEATAAGLPVVCTRVCGAATRLVLDGYNGVVMTPDSPDAVATGLQRIGAATDAERRAMGEGSAALAKQYSPERWASNLLRRLDELVADVELVPLPRSRASAAAGR